MDAYSGLDRPRCGAARPGGGRRLPVCSPWSTSRPRSIRCGKSSCAMASSIRPSPRRSAGASLSSTPTPHGATTSPRVFATDHIFFPIRLEPYLAATARIHADCAAQLQALIDVTPSTKLALVHGDVSPKNILCGPHGPVFLDAECAWYGDPAFDLAFCLNHTLLKCAWRPHWTDGYLACFDALSAGLSRDSRLGARREPRSAHCTSFAGPAPGARRRQITRRVHHRRLAARPACAKWPTSLLRKPVAALSEVRAMLGKRSCARRRRTILRSR